MGKHRHDTATTQRELIESGRASFSKVGYAAASTTDIVESVGLTRGALYHQFGNKEGLFLAVLEEVHVEVANEVSRKGKRAKGGAVESLRAGFHAWLDAVLQDDVRQVLLVDGPAVLGWERWQEIDQQHGYSVTRATLGLAMKNKEIAKAPLDELTHVLMGALTQAGLELGRSEDRSRVRSKYRKVIDLLIDGLRA